MQKCRKSPFPRRENEPGLRGKGFAAPVVPSFRRSGRKPRGCPAGCVQIKVAFGGISLEYRHGH